MKKLCAVMLATLLLIFSASCGSANQEFDNNDEETTSIREEEIVAEGERTTILATTKIPTTTTTTTSRKTTTTTAQIGSRKNPSPFGEKRGVIGTLYDGTEFEYQINVTNLRRGEEAKALAMSWNKFNEIGEDQEAIVFDVEFELLKYNPEDDDSYWVSYYDFEYYTSTFTSYRGGSIVGSDNEFGGKLYEGGQLTGDVIMLIPKGDQGYLQFDDFLWYALP